MMTKSKDSLRDLKNNIEHTNIHIIGAPEEKRERCQKIYLKK